jgi:hypothetical protein
MDDNPYQSPRAKSDRRPAGPEYDPLQTSRKLTGVWWIVAFIVATLAVASLVFG